MDGDTLPRFLTQGVLAVDIKYTTSGHGGKADARALEACGRGPTFCGCPYLSCVPFVSHGVNFVMEKRTKAYKRNR